MSTKPVITFAQSQAAMTAMIEKAMQTPDESVAIAIVDDARREEGKREGGSGLALPHYSTPLCLMA